MNSITEEKKEEMTTLANQTIPLFQVITSAQWDNLMNLLELTEQQIQALHIDKNHLTQSIENSLKKNNEEIEKNLNQYKKDLTQQGKIIDNHQENLQSLLLKIIEVILITRDNTKQLKLKEKILYSLIGFATSTILFIIFSFIIEVI